jgi:hypothetical protein
MVEWKGEKMVDWKAEKTAVLTVGCLVGLTAF